MRQLFIDLFAVLTPAEDVSDHGDAFVGNVTRGRVASKIETYGLIVIRGNEPMRAFVFQIVPLPVDIIVSGEDFGSVAGFSFRSDLLLELCHGFLQVIGDSGLVRFEKAVRFLLPDFVGCFGPFFCLVVENRFGVGVVGAYHVNVAA